MLAAIVVVAAIAGSLGLVVRKLINALTARSRRKGS
jgi:hypothetical protein